MIDPIPVNNASDSASTASATRARVTHCGKFRYGIVNKTTGDKAACTTNSICTPNQPVLLLDWNMTCSMHGVSVLVDFHPHSNYSFEVVAMTGWVSPRRYNQASVSDADTSCDTSHPSHHHSYRTFCN